MVHVSPVYHLELLIENPQLNSTANYSGGVMQTHQTMLPTLNYRRQSTDVIQTFKTVKGIDSVNQDYRCSQRPLKLMFQRATGITRGHSDKLQTQSATGYRHYFSTRVVTVWNSLSDNTVQARIINELKSRLRRDWTGHPDLYIFSSNYRSALIDYANRTKAYMKTKYTNRETASS